MTREVQPAQLATQVNAVLGVVQLGEIVNILRTTYAELAQTLGVSEDELRCEDCAASDRIRQMVAILDKAAPRLGSPLLAYAWYRSTPLPGFSGRTAMDLVQDGRAGDVPTYIDAVDAGIFA